MRGIFGVVNSSLSAFAVPEVLTAMANDQVQRELDDRDFLIEDRAGMGIIRPDMGDIVAGNQPVHSHDNRCTIVFDGEIYNHSELRQEPGLKEYPFTTSSGAETFLAAYMQWGCDCLRKLNGVFAAAVWERAAQSLFLARDRFGAKPLYWRLHDGIVYFSSEAAPLLAVIDKPGPDMDAIAQYLQFGYVPSPLCVFEGIERFPAGHWATFDGGRINMRRWHNHSFGSGRPRGGADLLDELDARLERTVAREFPEDVPAGVFLSGGIDSSLVAAYAARRHPGIPSFAMSFEEETHDESRDAEMVAKHLRLPHRRLRLSRDELSQVFAGPSLPCPDLPGRTSAQS